MANAWESAPIVSEPIAKKASNAAPANWQAINASIVAGQPGRDSERLTILQQEYDNEKNPGNREALAREIKRAGGSVSSKATAKSAWMDAPIVSEEPKTDVRTPRQNAAPKKEEVSDNPVVGALAGVGSGVGKVVLGAQHYVGKGLDAVGMDTVGQWLVEDAAKGRAKLKREIDQYKEKSPIATGAGELTGEIVSTLPVGGFLAKGVRAISQAPRAVQFANALASGGFTTSNSLARTASIGQKAADLGVRTAGGAITGGAAAGLVNPDDASTGAVIGGALPPGLRIAGEAGKLLHKGAATTVKNVLGVSTGTGADSIGTAYRAGKDRSTAFLDNMRGNASFDDVVDDARLALQRMRAERGEAYRSGMVDISNDKAVIDFKPISNAVAKVNQMGSYKGQQINKNAAGTVDEIMAKVKEWESLNPAEYHTPEGLDALKQAIGDIRDSTQFGTAARRAADSVYHAIKDQITAQAPTYSKVMKDYSQASSTLKEIEKSLSLGDKTSRDTAVRKLQSLLRNNAQTNYGNRLDLARTLEDRGGVDLIPSIAGQTMNSLMPRGLAGAIQKGGAVVGAVGTGGASIPFTLAAAPFTSPRLVGEALYGIGRASGAAGSTINRLAQGSPLLSTQSPGLVEARNALYRSVPLIAISANRTAQR